jgi:hypothetical protein
MPAKYGFKHQQDRARAIAQMVDGQPCARCAVNGVLHPLRLGELVQLDHLPDGSTALSSKRCNLRHGGQLGRAVQLGRPLRPEPQVRVCAVCGLGLSPRSGGLTCGRSPCMTELKRARREGREPGLEPPEPTGRLW